MKQALARFLSVVVVAFFAVFILEGFGSGGSWGDMISHLASALVALAVAVIAWKWPKIGGWLFIVLGVAWFVFLKLSVTSVIIAAVPIVTGILFLL